MKRRTGLISAVLICGLSLLFAISCSRQPSKPDRELFSDFYKDIMRQAKGLDAQYKSFVTLVEQDNLVDAINRAKEIESDARKGWSKMQAMTVPKLTNREASDDLKIARESFAAAYFYKLQVLTEFLKYTKEPKLDTVARMKKSGDDADKLIVSGVTKLVSTAKKLGLTIDEMEAMTKNP